MDEAWEHFEKSTKEAIDKSVLKKKWSRNLRGRKPLWMNSEALKKVKKKREAYQRYMETREGREYCEYAKARNQAKWACKKAVRDFERCIAREAKKNPKAFYAYARSKLRTKEGVADLEDKDGEPVTSDRDKASMLNDFFCSVFTFYRGEYRIGTCIHRKDLPRRTA